MQRLYVSSASGYFASSASIFFFSSGFRVKLLARYRLRMIRFFLPALAQSALRPVFRYRNKLAEIPRRPLARNCTLTVLLNRITLLATQR